MGERLLNSLSIIGNIFTNALSFVGTSWGTELSTMTPLMRGVILQIVVIIILVAAIHIFRKKQFGIAFSLFFEGMYEFFEEILGKKEKRYIKIYIVSLFFIILISNLLSFGIDLIRVVFLDIELLPHYIVIPTTDFNFNLALALVSIVLSLLIQLHHAGPVKFFLEYLPITGKGVLKVERGTMKAIFYYPIRFIVKIFDICISVFVGLLDVVGVIAKAVSLTARLYGNMLAGGILLGLLVGGVNALFHGVFADGFPAVGPVILYIQGLLVALIQAFVFPLLIAIFIKMVQGDSE